MGLYDDIDNEVLAGKTNTNNNASVGLFDDIDNEVLNAPTQPSFMDNIKGFGGKVKNAVSNMGISNPYEDIARQTLKGGIETNVFQPNQYGVTPLEGIGNIASDIGSGVKQFAKAPFEFAKQFGRDTIATGKNIAHNPALLKDVPSAIMTGLKDLPFDVAQAVIDLPETIASSYNNRPFERQVNIPNSDEFAENMATNLLNIFLNEEQKRRNQELHQQRLQQIAQEREKLNQLPIAQTIGAFMLPASNIAKVAKTKGIADSIKTGTKWGLATTSGSVEDRTVGTLGGGAFGGTLHAGIKTAPKIAKGVKNASAEIVDRLNPENYEQVINSKPVKKGTGLSQRTVYEPEVRYEYKPKRNTYNMKDALGKERITQKGIDFTMGESGELKNPERPVKKKYGVSTNVQYTPKFTIERVAPSVFAKQQAKKKAKEEARQEKMEELAPNTMAEQEAKANIKEAQKNGTLKRTSDFQKGEIVRNVGDGEIYEIVEPNKDGIGELRNVDTGEMRATSANSEARYEKYEHNPDDLIEVFEFKYEPKAKRGTNADNYMFSRQSVVDAYNEYIKNPTEANKEKYEDVSGAALKEFYDNEEAIKNGTFKPNTNPASLEGYPIEKTSKLIPFNPESNEINGLNRTKISFDDLEKVDSIDDATHHDMVNGGFYRQKQHIETTEKGNTNEVVGSEGNTNNKELINKLFDKEINTIEKEPQPYTGERNINAVLEYLGSKDNKTATIKTPVEDVIFNENNLTHLIEDNNNERLQDLNKAIRTLQEPNLVVNNIEDGKNYNYYIKTFEGNDKVKAHLQIVKKCEDGSFYVTNYSAKTKKLNKVLNNGEIIYKMSDGYQEAPVNNIIPQNEEKITGINNNQAENTKTEVKQKSKQKTDQVKSKESTSNKVSKKSEIIEKKTSSGMITLSKGDKRGGIVNKSIKKGGKFEVILGEKYPDSDKYRVITPTYNRPTFKTEQEARDYINNWLNENVPTTEKISEVKKTTVTMKSGKTKEIEYVENIPEGYIEDKGATTAPRGYTWYHNNKSITSGERKRILIKDSSDIYDVDIPEFLKDMNTNTTDSGADIDLSPIYEGISKGIKGENLAKLLPEEIAEIIEKDAKNYTFGEMITNDSKKKGVHSGKKATIKLNLEAIGNSPYKFIKTLSHEVRHARQHKIYLRILAKPENTRTQIEKKFIENYNKCKEVNKELQKHYNKHSDLIDKFERNNFNNAVERVEAIEKLTPREQNVIDTHDQNLENYQKDLLELDADTKGIKDAEGYRKKSGYTLSRQTKTKSNGYRNGKKWSLGTNSQNSITSGEYSTEQSEYKQVKNTDNSDEIKIEKSGKDKIYDWHADIETKRFDVNKTLQSTINISNSLAKELSKAKDIKNLSGKTIRELLPFLRERTEVPEELGRKDLSKLYNSLDKQDIARLTKFTDDVCGKFDKYWQNYKEVKGVLTDEDIENHISHIWETTKSHKGLLTNFFNTNSKFAKPRTIETLVKGISAGLKPKTLDIAEILKIQSDSLIKAAADSVLANDLKNMRYDGEMLVQQAAKAPADWVEINHPALNKAVFQSQLDNGGALMSKQSVKVHPALADVIAPVFEVQNPTNKFWKAYDIVNGTLKQVQMGFSGFHGYALSESAIGNMGLRGTLKSINPKAMWNAIKNGDYDIYKQDKAAKEAIENGLQLGTPIDLDRNLVENFLHKIPGLGKLIGGAVEVNNKILWDCLHNSYKLESYKMACQEAVEKQGKPLSKEQHRAIAQWVNDSFGGQAWELLGIKKSTVKGLSRAMLSPDWFISTTRQFIGMFNNEKVDNIVEANNIKGLKKVAKLFGATEMSDAAGLRGKAARKFWVTAMLYSLVFYNVLNAMFRVKDRKEHPELYTDNKLIDYTIWGNALVGDNAASKVMPYIFIGRNKDGSARYLRLGKQFREVPELLSEPVSKLAMKSASLPSVASQSILGYGVGDIPKKLLGKDDEVFYNQELYKGFGKRAKRKEGTELIKGGMKTALKTSAPFIMQSAFNEHHNKSAWDLFAQTSNGLGYTKASKQYKAAYEKGSKPEDFEKITQKAIQDGMNYKKIKSSQKKAKTDFTNELIEKYSSQYVEALKQQNQQKINKIADKLENDNVPADIRIKVYKSALKEYRKSTK